MNVEHSKRTRWAKLTVLILAMALVAAACTSGGEDTATTTTGGGDTATTTTGGGDTATTTTGGGDAATTTTPDAGGTTTARPVLRIGQVGDLRSLEPYRNASPNYLFIENVFDQLLFNEKNEGLTSEAAEVVLADDNLSVTITLREGLITHDGSVADAAMLASNFEDRVAVPEHGVAMYNAMKPYYAGVEIIDDLTLKVLFDAPAPHGLYLMALMAIADPDMFVKADGSVALGNEEETQIATGPFSLKEYIPGTSMSLVGFDGYWEENTPILSSIEITFFGDAASMIAALESGEIDLAFNPPFDSVARLATDPAFTAWVPETAGVSAILMVNPEREQLNDPLVRQAINIAINRDAVNAAAYAGLAVNTASPVPPSSPGYSPSLEVPAAGDLDAARALLEQAGADGIALGITYPGNNDTARLSAEVVAANLQEIGIDAVLDPVEQGVWVDRRGSQDFDILWSLIAGANKHPAGLEDTFAYAHIDNKFFDEIPPQDEYVAYSDAFTRALAATDESVADAAWKEALIAADEGSWVVVLVGQPFTMLSTSELKGVTWTEADKPVFKYSYFEG